MHLAPAALAQQPTPVQLAQNDNGNIGFTYFEWTDLPCSGPCSTGPETLSLMTGFDHAEILLTGYEVYFDDDTQDLRYLAIAFATGNSYDPLTGEVDITAEVEFLNQSGGTDAYNVSLYFVVVQYETGAASLVPVGRGCSNFSGSTCSEDTTAVDLIPSGMEFAGVGLRGFSIGGFPTGGSAVPGIDVQDLAQEVSTDVNGDDVDVKLDCVMDPAVTMGCSADYVALLVSTAEADGFTFGRSSSSVNSFVSSPDSENLSYEVAAIAALSGYRFTFAAGANEIWYLAAGGKDFDMGNTALEFTRLAFIGSNWNSFSTASYGYWLTFAGATLIF